MTRGRAITLLVALAAAPPAYAAFVFAWQLTDVLALMVRQAGAPVPEAVWVSILSLLLRLIGVSVALFVVGRGVRRADWRTAGLAMAGAWVIAAPTLLLLAWR